MKPNQRKQPKQAQSPIPAQVRKKRVSNAIAITANAKKIYESEPTGMELLRSDFVPFFKTQDKFLQFLYFAARSSSTHSACVNAKTSFTYGEGVMVVDNEQKTETLKNWLRSLNGKRETNGKEIKKGITDYYRTGNAFYERTEKDGVLNLHHIQTKNARIKKDSSGIVMSKDFFTSSVISDAKFLPFYPNFITDEKGVKRSVIHVAADKYEGEYYGQPDSVSALVDMELEYRISSWNKAEFDNGFRPSSFMQFVGDYEAEEAVEFLRDMQSKFVGDGTNGQIVLQTVPSKDLFANLQEFSSSRKDGDFNELAQRAETNILKAHRLPKVLAGIPIAGKLGGDTKEIETAYNYCLSTVIYPVQAEFIGLLSESVFDFVCGGVNQYEIIDNPPISMADTIDANEVLTLNEKRALLGYEQINEATK